MATYDAARSDRLILKATRISKHRYPNDTDWAYWRGHFRYCWERDGEAGIEYAYQRCLGMGANSDGKHPEDVPPFGPYGLDPNATAPNPYPEESEEAPPPPPAPDPGPTDLAQVVAALERIATRVASLDATLAALVATVDRAIRLGR